MSGTAVGGQIETKDAGSQAIDGFFNLIFVLIAAFFIYVMGSYLLGSVFYGAKSDGSFDALSAAKIAVREQMRDPKSLEFDTTSTGKTDTGWNVTGTGRARNGFGGMMPFRFRVELTNTNQVIRCDVL